MSVTWFITENVFPRNNNLIETAIVYIWIASNKQHETHEMLHVNMDSDTFPFSLFAYGIGVPTLNSWNPCYYRHNYAAGNTGKMVSQKSNALKTQLHW